MTSFRLAGEAPDIVAEIDGVNYASSLWGVFITATAETNTYLPRVDLRLVLTKREVDLPAADIRVDADTAELLIRLGWTPPPTKRRSVAP